MKKRSVKASEVTATPLINQLINKFEFEQLKEGKQSWEKLKEMYNDIGTAILNSAHGINDHMAIIGQFSKEHPDFNLYELNVTVGAVNSDLQVITQQLRDTYMTHSDKTGEVSEDDYALCLEVFNSYVMINDQFRALIFPAMLTLTEKVVEITSIIKKEAQVQDIKVITDVVVKETTESV